MEVIRQPLSLSLWLAGWLQPTKSAAAASAFFTVHPQKGGNTLVLVAISNLENYLRPTAVREIHQTCRLQNMVVYNRLQTIPRLYHHILISSYGSTSFPHISGENLVSSA